MACRPGRVHRLGLAGARRMTPPEHPTPKQIRTARIAAQLNQVDAATLIYQSPRAWRGWELGERVMDAGLWELFGIKAPTAKPSDRLRKT